MTPERRAELEEERSFLLTSLEDLEREHAAGDVDEGDYRTLRDGYIARAAFVLRALQHDQAARPALPRRRKWTVAAVVAGTLAVGGVAGYLVAHYSGQRLAGQGLTGGQPGDEVSVQLTQARTLLGNDNAAAAKAYQAVLSKDPANAEAMTYLGWIAVLAGAQSNNTEAVQLGIGKLRQATQIDASYADPHCLLAVALGQISSTPDVAAARAEATTCLADNPPAAMVQSVQAYLSSLSSTPTT